LRIFGIKYAEIGVSQVTDKFYRTFIV